MDWPDGSGARRLGSDGLKTWWKNQSRKTRQQVPLQVAMAEHLIECDDHDTAQEILLDGLKRQYDDRLVMVIPRLKTNNPEQLEKVLRQQIKTVGDRPLLWSTLGQSLMKHGEWQEASLAFRAALKQRPDAFDYAWLADTLDKQHKPEEAAAMRRDGLLLTLQNNGTSSNKKEARGPPFLSPFLLHSLHHIRKRTRQCNDVFSLTFFHTRAHFAAWTKSFLKGNLMNSLLYALIEALRCHRWLRLLACAFIFSSLGNGLTQVVVFGLLLAWSAPPALLTLAFLFATVPGLSAAFGESCARAFRRYPC
jgi:tetratricopeptide (TPR) repeat protein